MKSNLPDKGLRDLGTWGLRFFGWVSRMGLVLLALLLPVLPAAAQTGGAAQPEMAEVLRQSGKIYVVVVVIAVVMAGLLLFLISLDRKLSRLEKEVAAER